MKASKCVKLGFRLWKTKSESTNVSLKVWARNHNTGGTELAQAIEQWFKNKRNN